MTGLELTEIGATAATIACNIRAAFSASADENHARVRLCLRSAAEQAAKLKEKIESFVRESEAEEYLRMTKGTESTC